MSKSKPATTRIPVALMDAFNAEVHFAEAICMAVLGLDCAERSAMVELTETHRSRMMDIKAQLDEIHEGYAGKSADLPPQN